MLFLCQICRAIPTDLFRGVHRSYEHHESYSSLSEAAHKGCELCKLILWRVNSKWPADTHDRVRLTAQSERIHLDRSYRQSNLNEPAAYLLVARGVLPWGELTIAEITVDRPPREKPYDWLGLRHTYSIRNLTDQVNEHVNSTTSHEYDLAVSEHLALELAHNPPQVEIAEEHVHVEMLADCSLNHERDIITPSSTLTPTEAYYISGLLNQKGPRLPPLATLTISDIVLLCGTWLQSCQGLHEHCRKSIGFRPSRLIAVGSSGDVDVKLVSDLDGRPEYIALSYCWGVPSVVQKEAISTLRNSLSRRLEGIRVDDLPRTFRQLIGLARGLGIRYVWIDSLCIVQDDEHDWQREASVMGQVYQNAKLTVAATDGTTPDDGLYGLQRDTPSSIDLQYTPAKSNTTGKSATFTLHPYLPPWRDAIRGGHLSSRGWALQERQLSRRILSFSRHQLFWECSFCSATESYPESGWDHGKEGLAEPVLYTHIQQPNDIGPMAHTALTQTIKTWREMSPADQQAAKRFTGGSSCSFTYDKDLLPAIAGIASNLAAKFSDTYVAGLWKKDLAYGLCWQVTTVDPVARPSVYRAPSWSCASVKSPVTFHAEYTDPANPSPWLLDVLDAGCDPYSRANPFGAVTTGWLRARVITKTGVIKWESFVPYLGSAEQNVCTVIWDDEALADNSDPGKHGHSRINLRLDAADDFVKDGQKIHAALLAITPEHGLFALALLPTPGKTKNTFRRIGMINFDGVNFFGSERPVDGSSMGWNDLWALALGAVMGNPVKRLVDAHKTDIIIV